MNEPAPLPPSLPHYAPGIPKAQVAQQKPLVKLMNRALKSKLPRLFSRGKTIESSSNVKVSHKRRKEQTVKYW